MIMRSIILHVILYIILFLFVVYYAYTIPSLYTFSSVSYHCALVSDQMVFIATSSETPF